MKTTRPLKHHSQSWIFDLHSNSCPTSISKPFTKSLVEFQTPRVLSFKWRLCDDVMERWKIMMALFGLICRYNEGHLTQCVHGVKRNRVEWSEVEWNWLRWQETKPYQTNFKNVSPAAVDFQATQNRTNHHPIPPNENNSSVEMTDRLTVSLSQWSQPHTSVNGWLVSWLKSLLV